MDDFLKLMDEKPNDDDPNTVSGWIMEKLGKMPELGDTFEYNGHHIYVIEMENRRVAKIKVKILQNK